MVQTVLRFSKWLNETNLKNSSLVGSKNYGYRVRAIRAIRVRAIRVNPSPNSPNNPSPNPIMSNRGILRILNIATTVWTVRNSHHHL